MFPSVSIFPASANFSLTVTTHGGTSVPKHFGLPVLDWVSPYIRIANVNITTRESPTSIRGSQHIRPRAGPPCDVAVYGRRLDRIMGGVNPRIELTAVDATVHSFPITQFSSTRLCFLPQSSGEVLTGVAQVRACGIVCTASVPSEVIAPPVPITREVNASAAPYTLDSSGASDVTSGLRQAITDAISGIGGGRARVVLSAGTFRLDPRHGVPTLGHNACALCFLQLADQVVIEGAGINETVLLVGSGTDAAFLGFPVSLEGLSLSDEPAPPHYASDLGGYSNRALWSMVSLSIIPPGAVTPANSTGSIEFARYGGVDVSFRQVRFVAHRVGTAVALRYLRRVVIENCEFSGGGVQIWGPLINAKIRNNKAQLSCGTKGGAASPTEAPLPCAGFVDMLGWGGSGHVSDVDVENNQLSHLNPPETSFFPGRLVVGQVYFQRHIYVGGNVNLQAGPGRLCDQNQGEQVLFETANADISIRAASVSSDGTHLTVISTTGIDSPGIVGLYNRVGIKNDTSTAAVAWSYFRGIGQVHIQQGTGSGQSRTIVGVSRNHDNRCVIQLDRPFIVSPDSTSSILNVMVSSTAKAIVENNHFVSVNKSHVFGPHVATSAVFLWSNTVRYTAVNNIANWIRYGVSIFSYANTSLVDVLSSGLTVENSYTAVDLIPSLQGGNGANGVVVRNVTSTGSISTAAVTVDLPPCRVGSIGANATGGTGVIIDRVAADNAPISVLFQQPSAQPGKECNQPAAYTQAILSNSKIVAPTSTSTTTAVVLNGSAQSGVGLWMANTTYLRYTQMTGGYSPPRGRLRLPRPRTTGDGDPPWRFAVGNDGTRSDTAIVTTDGSLVPIGPSKVGISGFGGLGVLKLAPNASGGRGGCGTVCLVECGECLPFCISQ